MPLDVVDHLAHLPWMVRVPLSDLRAAAGQWTLHEGAPGEVVWPRGEPPGIALGLRGRLAVHVGEARAGLVEPGEVVGEATAFLRGDVEPVSLRGVGSAVVLALGPEALRRLRAEENLLYQAILEHSTRNRARRLAGPGRRPPPPAPMVERREPTWLTQLLEVLRLRPAPTAPPPLEPLLAALMEGPPPSAAQLAALQRSFTPRPLVAGEPVYRVGEPADGAGVVAEGEVALTRKVDGGEARVLARVGAGGIVGLGSAVEGGRRTLDAVALAPGWVHWISSLQIDRLTGVPRTLWWEVMLRGLARPLREGDRRVRGALELGGEAANPVHAAGGIAELRALLAASGWAGDIPEHDLARVQAVALPRPNRRASDWAA